MNNVPVPVIMYHSVGIPNENWCFNYLTCPYDIFESQLKWLKSRGFKTISLDELYQYMAKGIEIPKNSVVLTFDDGYADNWVFSYPLLKKYGMKATIYINPEFIESRKEKPNLEDVWENKSNVKDLDTLGYLSWEELKIMEKEGVVDIQSHSMTHTWYSKSDKIIDFRHPNDQYFWMTFNENIDEKSHLHIDNSDLVLYGEPVYEYDRAIGTRKYLPDLKLNEYLVNYVRNHGSDTLFNHKGWKDELFNLVKEYKKNNSLNGRFETEREYEERMYYELKESKRIIETKLKKDVKFLCWPGGSVTEKALQIASEVGYISSTAAKDMINERKYLKNIPGEDPSRINRIDAVMYWDGVEGPESKIEYKNGFYLTLSLYNYQNRFLLSRISFLILVIISLKNKFLK